MFNIQRNVKWSEVQHFVNAVAEKYEDYNLSGVYGVPRGGLVLAVMLSHKLAIPLLGAPADNCLVVDDIADSGESLIHVKGCGYEIATMFYHKRSKVVPDFWMYEKEDDWIVYPWEDFNEDSEGTL